MSSASSAATCMTCKTRKSFPWCMARPGVAGRALPAQTCLLRRIITLFGDKKGEKGREVVSRDTRILGSDFVSGLGCCVSSIISCGFDLF
jgi:hypothetical protein